MSTNTQSISEKKLIAELVNVGLYPKPQYKISEMHVDLAFPEKMMVVEIDGPFHKETKEKDASRDHELTKRGWTVFRYPSNEAHDTPVELALKIRKEYDKQDNIKRKKTEEISDINNIDNKNENTVKSIKKEKSFVEKVAYSSKVSYPWKIILALLIIGLIIVIILNKFG